MSCPLLFEINNDISSIIDVYVKTFQNRKRMKEELKNKIRQSLIKKFNMKINNVTLDNYLNNTEGYLYWKPKSPGWIWLGKRFLFDNPNVNNDFRKILKDEGLLTRDPRMVERKKYGRKKARKKFQFSKR